MEPGPTSAGEPIGVAVVEDSVMLRELLENVVNDSPEFELVGSAGTCRQATEGIEWDRVSFAVLDLHLPDGLGVALGAHIREWNQAARVAILSDHRRRSLLSSLTADELPYWSYILKSSLDGRRHLADLLAKAAVGSYIDPNIEVSVGKAEEAINNLSDQQRRILGLVARGLSNGAIAKQLFLSEKSVEYNLTQTYQALGLTGDASANMRVSAAVLYLQRFTPDIHI